jgi:hypothetical protein
MKPYTDMALFNGFVHMNNYFVTKDIMGLDLKKEQDALANERIAFESKKQQFMDDLQASIDRNNNELNHRVKEIEKKEHALYQKINPVHDVIVFIKEWLDKYFKIMPIDQTLTGDEEFFRLAFEFDKLYNIEQYIIRRRTEYAALLHDLSNQR